MVFEIINVTDTDTGLVYKTPVPAKFYSDFAKAQKRLEEAQNNISSPTKLKKSKEKYEKLEKQLLIYTKNFKERPQRHTAEVGGLLTKKGDVKTLKTGNALIMAALVGGIGTIAFTLATGGVGLALVVPVAATVLAAYVAFDPIVDPFINKEFKKHRIIIKQKILEEDIKFNAKKYYNSQQNTNTKIQRGPKYKNLKSMSYVTNNKDIKTRRGRVQQKGRKKSKNISYNIR